MTTLNRAGKKKRAAVKKAAAAAATAAPAAAGASSDAVGTSSPGPAKMFRDWLGSIDRPDTPVKKPKARTSGKAIFHRPQDEALTTSAQNHSLVTPGKMNARRKSRSSGPPTRRDNIEMADAVLFNKTRRQAVDGVERKVEMLLAEPIWEGVVAPDERANGYFAKYVADRAVRFVKGGEAAKYETKEEATNAMVQHVVSQLFGSEGVDGFKERFSTLLPVIQQAEAFADGAAGSEIPTLPRFSDSLLQGEWARAEENSG